MAILRFAGIVAVVSAALVSALVACSSDHSGDAGDGGVDAGTLYLEELSVSSSSVPTLTLIPAFSPAIFDYYVLCAGGSNAISVTMKASPGANSILEAPSGSGSAPARQQTLDVSVPVNQAIVAAATDGTRSVEYWVRCLPPDFPTILWDPHPEAGVPTPGYYLIGTSLLPKPAASYAFILDSHGVPVWYIAAPGAAAMDGTMDVDHIVDGAVSFYFRTQPAPFHKWEIRQFSPLATTYAYAGPYTDEHEVQHLPNGNFLTISKPTDTGVDLTGLQIPLPDGGVETLNGPQAINGCVIYESTPDHRIVWTWDALDHFEPRKDTTYPVVEGTGPGGVPSYSVFHCNAIDVDPKTGNLLVSSRHMDSIFYIDKATKAVLWKMGGKKFTKEGAPYIEVLSPFFRQHDARLRPGWSQTCAGGHGQISLFDDETAAGPTARGVVYDVTVGPPSAGSPGCPHHAGTPSGTATVAWEYAGTVASFETGSFRISSDGSRVIGWGGNSLSRIFTEVDVAKNDLLDMSFTRGGESYRAIKVPLGAYDLEAMRKAAGLP